MRPFDLAQLLDLLAHELADLRDRRMLSSDWVLDGSWNQRSWLHARVLGALARAVQRPLVPMLEINWSRGFCPDLAIVDDSERIVAVVEYESTNSSDERLVGKDLYHFEQAIVAARGDPAALPPWWVLISTLPDQPVRNWPWYEWNTLGEYPPVVKDRKARNVNPLAYYGAGLHEALGAMWGRIVTAYGSVPTTNVVWVNLGGDLSLTTLNINGQKVATV